MLGILLVEEPSQYQLNSVVSEAGTVTPSIVKEYWLVFAICSTSSVFVELRVGAVMVVLPARVSFCLVPLDADSDMDEPYWSVVHSLLLVLLAEL